MSFPREHHQTKNTNHYTMRQIKYLVLLGLALFFALSCSKDSKGSHIKPEQEERRHNYLDGKVFTFEDKEDDGTLSYSSSVTYDFAYPRVTITKEERAERKEKVRATEESTSSPEPYWRRIVVIGTYSYSQGVLKLNLNSGQIEDLLGKERKPQALSEAQLEVFIKLQVRVDEQEGILIQQGLNQEQSITLRIQTKGEADDQGKKLDNGAASSVAQNWLDGKIFVGSDGPNISIYALFKGSNCRIIRHETKGLDNYTRLIIGGTYVYNPPILTVSVDSVVERRPFAHNRLNSSDLGVPKFRIDERASTLKFIATNPFDGILLELNTSLKEEDIPGLGEVKASEAEGENWLSGKEFIKVGDFGDKHLAIDSLSFDVSTFTLSHTDIDYSDKQSATKVSKHIYKGSYSHKEGDEAELVVLEAFRVTIEEDGSRGTPEVIEPAHRGAKAVIKIDRDGGLLSVWADGGERLIYRLIQRSNFWETKPAKGLDSPPSNYLDNKTFYSSERDDDGNYLYDYNLYIHFSYPHFTITNDDITSLASYGSPTIKHERRIYKGTYTYDYTDSEKRIGQILFKITEGKKQNVFTGEITPMTKEELNAANNNESDERFIVDEQLSKLVIQSKGKDVILEKL